MAVGQSLTYTFMDPCTKDITYFSIPIQSGSGTMIFFLGKQRYFTANDVVSGEFAKWINQSYVDYRKVSPCGVQQGQVTQNQITAQIIGSTIQSVVGSIMSQAKSESNTSTSDGGLVSENNNNSGDNKKSKNGKNNTNGGSNTTSNSSSDNGGSNSTSGGETNSQGSTSSTSTTSSSTNTTNNNSGSSTSENDNNGTTSGNNSAGSSQTNDGSNSSTSQGNNQGNAQTNGQTGGSSNSSTTQTGGQDGGQGSGDNTTKTEGGEVAGATTMTVDAKNDRGSDNSSSGGKGGKNGGKGGGRNNPIIVSSDLTNAQNLDRSFTGIINVGTSQSSMTGASSWGINSMIWFNFKQFAITGRYTKIHYSKNRKVKLIHNLNLTGVYSYGNVLGFLGYSVILNAGKWGVTGINISGAATKTPEDNNLFISPSATAFYTKPFKVGKRIILSPELYIISTPLIYSSVDRVTVSDRTFSAFIGTGVDYQISKRFKINMNYKLNTSTNPDFPILSFFLIGSKVNL
jgi:hypothetical protein